MMFDPNNGAAKRQRTLIVGVVAAVWLTAISLIGYVAVHFIVKFW